MKIPFAEPMSPRYIYINPETNQVHLLVPLVQGQGISTDNTCKSTAALTEFKNAAFNELNTYKSGLGYQFFFIASGGGLRGRGVQPGTHPLPPQGGGGLAAGLIWRRLTA